ncbi:MAG: patatin family protein [Erysipelotrichaceae bacterium]
MIINNVCLVTEGGGMRGAYTAGCLKWLVDNEIYFANAYSISATGLHMASYCQQDVKALYDLSVTYICGNKNVGLYPLLHEGQLVGYEFLFDYLLQNTVKFDIDKIRNSPIRFHIGSYCVTRAEQFWITNDNIDDKFQLLKASCTLPLTGKMIKHNGDLFIDGGVLSMMPIKKAISDGNTKFLAITTKPLDYVRKDNSGVIKTLLKMFYHKYPKMLTSINDRVRVYYEEMDLIDNLVQDNKAILMRPSRSFNVSRMKAETQDLIELFKTGYHDCEVHKDEIFKLLEINK